MWSQCYRRFLCFLFVVAKYQDLVVSKPILKQTGTSDIPIIFFPFISTSTRLPYDYSTLNKEKERLIEEKINLKLKNETQNG